MDELKNLVKEFCEERDWDQFHGPKDLAIGLVTEASELLEHFRFKSEAQCLDILNSAGTREAISDEIADVLFFILRFSQRFDIDLMEALKRKMDKNSRKYPVEFAKGSNRKYTEFKD